MRDTGLDEAIRAAGGVGALARKIGISQPSVSNWSRIPAERVLAVEAATGIDRSVLRPDLYSEQSSEWRRPRRGRCRARAGIHAARGAAVARARPGAARSARPRCAAMRRHSASPMPRSRKRRAAPTAERVEREYFNLFIGLGRGELLPYGSYYQSGFLHERPLARLREQLSRLGIERAEGEVRAGRSRGDPVRDHGGPDQRTAAGRGRRRSRSVREASFALDRTVLRRSGASRGGRRSTAMSGRSDACSWTSRRRLSHCRHEAAGEGATKGGYGDEARTQDEWTSAGVSSFVRLAWAPQQRRRARRSSVRPPPTPKATTRSGRRATSRIRRRCRPSIASTAIPRSEGEAVMLIKRTERQARRGALAHALPGQSDAGLDRRSFLRRSGLVAGGLAALGTLPLASVRRAEAGPPAKPGAAVTIRKNICTHCSVGCTVDRRSVGRRVDRAGARLGIAAQSRLALRQGRGGARTGARRPPAEISDEAGQRSVDQGVLGNRDRRDRRQDASRSARSRDRIRSTGSAPRNSPTKAPI